MVGRLYFNKAARINVVEQRVSELEYKAEENTQMMHREAK